MYKVIDAQEDPLGRLFSQVITPAFVLEKTASAELHPDIAKYIAGIKPNPGKVYVLVNALGAGEYYGSNLNGDFFEEAELNPTDPNADWGYKTFLSAGIFRNHSNKVKENTLGKVVCAVFNSKMKRVELILEVCEKLCNAQNHGDLFTKLKNGDKPSVSMGCRVAHDSCSVCGHLSKTVSDHCVHFKTQQGQILPGGKKVFVYNPKPRFFDLSIVVIGADRTSYVMSKVASLRGSQHSARSYEDPVTTRMRSLLKHAAQRKRAAIDKEVPAIAARVIPALNRGECDLPDNVLDCLGNHCDLGSALSACTSAGMVLKPREFQRVVIIHIGRPGLANEMDRAGCIFGPCDDLDSSISMPVCPPMSGSTGIGGLLDILAPLMSARSSFSGPLAGRIMLIKTGSVGTGAHIEPRQYDYSPLSKKISAAYNSYRDQVIEKIASLVGNITARDVRLLSAAQSRALEDTLVRTGPGIKTASAGALALLGPTSLAYLYGAHRGPGGLTKTASAFLGTHPLVALSVSEGITRLGGQV